MNSETMTILITGTNRGLGFYLADYFLKNGHTVLSLIKSRNKEILRLSEEYRELHLVVDCDIRDEKKIIQAYKSVKETIPYIDILINNAAVHLEHQKPDIVDIDFSHYVPTVQVNSIGPLMIISHFLPLILNGRRKLIVNISSEAGSIGNSLRQTEFAYCMSKAALNMASKILQNRLKKDGIKVLAIHPGWFSSDMGGPDAPITPEQAANQVTNIILKKWSLTDPIYVDTDGKEMEW